MKTFEYLEIQPAQDYCGGTSVTFRQPQANFAGGQCFGVHTHPTAQKAELKLSTDVLFMSLGMTATQLRAVAELSLNMADHLDACAQLSQQTDLPMEAQA